MTSDILKFNCVYFLSLEQMRQVTPSSNSVVISILDKGELADKGRPDFNGFMDSLLLSFEDTYEEVKLGANWSDEPSLEEHSKYCQSKGELVPALSDARAIVEFLDKHSFKGLDLIVHCYGGISRSAAVAQWVSATYWVPLMNFHRSTDYANPRVIRLLNKAINR